MYMIELGRSHTFLFGLIAVMLGVVALGAQALQVVPVESLLPAIRRLNRDDVIDFGCVFSAELASITIGLKPGSGHPPPRPRVVEAYLLRVSLLIIPPIGFLLELTQPLLCSGLCDRFALCAVALTVRNKLMAYITFFE